MNFAIQLLKYVIILLVGIVYFGIIIPYLISTRNSFLSAMGITLAIMGIAGLILFIRNEINLYIIYIKDKKNEKGDETNESKHKTNGDSR